MMKKYSPRYKGRTSPRSFNPQSVGVKPVPQQTQKTQGNLKMNIKTDEKKGFQQFSIPTPKRGRGH